MLNLNLITRETLDKEYGPDGYITVSPSQLLVWFTCRYKWQLTYLLGWTTQSTRAMLKGTMTHELQQNLYQFYIDQGTGVEPLTKLQKVAIKDPVEKQYVQYEDTLLFYEAYTAFIRYLDFSINNDHFIPLLVEQELFVPTGLEYNGRPVFLHGFIDLIGEEAGGIIIMDHKSYNGDRGKWSANMVLFDQQLAFYCLMLHMLGYTPSVAYINGVNTYPYKSIQPLEKLFSRVPVAHTPERLEIYKANIFDAIDEMYTARRYTKRWTKDCAYCGYQEVCDMVLRGQNPDALLENKHSRKELDVTVDTIMLEELVEDGSE